MERQINLIVGNGKIRSRANGSDIMKMLFILPSNKQLRYMIKISKYRGIGIPESALLNRKLASDFIKKFDFDK